MTEEQQRIYDLALLLESAHSTHPLRDELDRLLIRGRAQCPFVYACDDDGEVLMVWYDSDGSYSHIDRCPILHPVQRAQEQP